jgi:hypothetical protein
MSSSSSSSTSSTPTSTSTPSSSSTTILNQTGSDDDLLYRNFVGSCKSPSTREEYVKALHHFMKYLRLCTNEYQTLVDPDPKTIQQNICDFIVHCKSTRNLAPKTISLYLAAVRHFYDQADIVQLNWKKINKFKPELLLLLVHRLR